MINKNNMKKIVCIITVIAIVAAGWIIYEKNNNKNDGVYPGMYIEYTSEDGESEQKYLYVCGVDWKDDSGHHEQIDVHLDGGPVTKNICMDVSQRIRFNFISYEPDKVLLLEVEENAIENFNEKDLAKAKEVDVDESFTCKQNCAYIMICYKENNWVAYSFSTFSEEWFMDNMKIEIYPLEKVVLDGEGIEFGDTKDDVEALLGTGEVVRESHRYFDGELGIYYDADGKVEFIEFYGGIDGKLKPTIYGVPVFQTKASELTAIIAEHDSSGITYTENAYELSFENISVGVYRDITPDAVNSMKVEMIADGVFDENDEDYLHDEERAQYWGTIGIGVEGYYK